MSFTAPSDTGGSAITGYTVTSSPDGLAVTGVGSPLTVSGLTNGTAYTFTVVATNTFGNSLASAPSNPVTPSGNLNVYFVHPDHLGTPRQVTDSQGTPVWTWENTEPFGDSAPNPNPSGTGNFTFNLRFPGQYFDAETGLHYNYFRDYDPKSGRYMQSDPIGLRGGINTYTYVSNNSLKHVDPKGLTDPNGEGRPSQDIGGLLERGLNELDRMFNKDNSSNPPDPAEEAKQSVTDAARSYAGEKCPKNDNCKGHPIPHPSPPSGWVYCLYYCSTAGSNALPRWMPIELGCPSPVPLAPGKYYMPRPRIPGTPVDIPFEGWLRP